MNRMLGSPCSSCGSNCDPSETVICCPGDDVTVGDGIGVGETVGTGVGVGLEAVLASQMELLGKSAQGSEGFLPVFFVLHYYCLL